MPSRHSKQPLLDVDVNAGAVEDERAPAKDLRKEANGQPSRGEGRRKVRFFAKAALELCARRVRVPAHSCTAGAASPSTSSCVAVPALLGGQANGRRAAVPQHLQ